MNNTVSYPSPVAQNVLTEIEKASPDLEVFEGQQFIEQDVYLDGRIFKNCTFRNCRIFIKLGWVGLNDNKMNDCTILFSGPAENTRVLVVEMLRSQNNPKP